MLLTVAPNVKLGDEVINLRINRKHSGKQSLRSNILLIGPSDCPEETANLIEIMYVLKFLEDAVIQIGRHIKNAFSAILDFDINSIVRERLNKFDIPIHDEPHSGAIL